MRTKTPFLTGCSTLFCGRAKRRKQKVLEAERSGISTWLAEKGIGDQKPIHYCRKPITALVAKKHGNTIPREYPLQGPLLAA